MFTNKRSIKHHGKWVRRCSKLEVKKLPWHLDRTTLKNLIRYTFLISKIHFPHLYSTMGVKSDHICENALKIMRYSAKLYFYLCFPMESEHGGFCHWNTTTHDTSASEGPWGQGLQPCHRGVHPQRYTHSTNLVPTALRIFRIVWSLPFK